MPFRCVGRWSFEEVFQVSGPLAGSLELLSIWRFWCMEFVKMVFDLYSTSILDKSHFRHNYMEM